MTLQHEPNATANKTCQPTIECLLCYKRNTRTKYQTTEFEIGIPIFKHVATIRVTNQRLLSVWTHWAYNVISSLRLHLARFYNMEYHPYLIN